MEAKRAVPRSEVSRDSISKQTGSASGNSSPSLRSIGNSWSTGPSTPGSPSGTGVNLTLSQIQCESRQACDPRISMDEYAYNKIFVGGLHYDTRDGKYARCLTSFVRSVSLQKDVLFFLQSSTKYSVHHPQYFRHCFHLLLTMLFLNAMACFLVYS